MKDPLGILQDTDTRQAGTSDPLGLLAAEEAPKRQVNTGVSLSEANEALRKNADAMKALDLWDTYSNLLTKSKADDEIRLAEDMIAKGKYDKDTQRVIRQRALSKADAIMKEGKMPDPNRPESSWWESVRSIFPRTLATTGKAAGGVIQNIGEVTGSKGLTETGEMLYKGASMAEKEATPNVPYGSAKETVGNIGVSSLQQIPLMFMTMLPGGQALSLGSFFTLAYGQQYGKRREEKAGVAESMLSAFGQGSSEWVTEIIPVSAAAKIFTSKFANLEKVGWRWLKGEFGGESINTFTQSLQGWAEKYPEKPFSEWLDTLPGEIKDTFIQTLGQSLILGAVGVPVVKARQAAYVHGVAKDIAKRTNLSPEEIKPIVNEVLKETKDDETGKAFVSTLQARINEIVRKTNDELTNKVTLSDEWKKATTDMLNDPANPASIIDIEKEIARNREENPKKANELQKFLDEYKSTLSTDDLNRLTIESEGSKLDAGPLAEGWLSPTGQSNIIKDLDIADKVQRIWEQFFPESGAKGAPRSYADRVETEREGEPTYTAQGKLIKPEVPGIPQRQTEETPSTLPVDETLETGEGKDIGEGLNVEQEGIGPQEIAQGAVTPGGYVKPDETSESIAKKIESLATDIDEKANEAATSPQNELPDPTEPQKQAGNYQLGHLNIQGLDISVENPKGSTRSGVSKQGKPWQQEMKSHYGYIRGTKSNKDGKLDVFVGESPESNNVYIVNQKDPTTGKFDELKVMLGFNTPNEARFGYLANYEKGWKGIKSIVPMTMDEFKSWLKDGDTTKELVKGAVPPVPIRAKEEKPVPAKQAEQPKDETPQWYINVDDRPVLTTKGDATLSGMRGPYTKQEISELTGTDKSYLNKAKQGEPVYTPDYPEKKVEQAQPAWGADNKIFTADEAEKARQRLRDMLNELQAGINPELLMVGMKLAGFHIEAGARKFKDYSARMIEDVGDKIKPYLKSFYLAVRNYPGFETTEGENEEAYEAPPSPKEEFQLEGGKGTIEDFGEKIGGARKDKWIDRGLQVNDLDEMTQQEKETYATKANIWPTPDYASFVEEGMPAEIAWLVKKIKDSISKQADIQQSRDLDLRDRLTRRYVEVVSKLKQELPKVRTIEDIAALKDELFPVGEKKSYGGMSYTDVAREDMLIIGGYDVMSAMKPSKWDLADAKRKIEKTGFPAKQEAWQRQYEIHLTKAGENIYRHGQKETLEADEWWVTKKNKYTILQDGFATKEEAEAWAKDQVKSQGGERLTRPYRENIERRGPDYRKGKDVTGNDILKQFGFRGGEFGNWTNEKDRQQALNEAYDGLMDLARVLNIPPQALSLNGELGIAFGSRGGGSAAAHYEPSRVVINLTKTRGAGTLAHEWAHAVDDYFGKIATSGIPGKYVSHGEAKTGVRKEVLDAWAYVMRAIAQRVASKETNIAEIKKDIERVTRYTDGWLKGVTAFLENRQDVDEIHEILDMLYDRRPKRLHGENVGPKELAAVLKGRLSGKGYKLGSDVVSAVGTNSWHLERYNVRLAKAEAGELATTEKTDFLTKAENISKSKKSYWTRKHELFARAFEAYVEDKIGAEGNLSEYLVHSTKEEMASHWAAIYPQGRDREAIGKAFDKLFQTIETKETDKGRAMFRIAPLYHGTPYQFDRFSIEKIGTGEGAQAFGWGLYFTDQQDIARFYANNLAYGNKVVYDGKEFGRDDFLNRIHEQYPAKDLGESAHDYIHDIAVLLWSDFVNGYSWEQTIHHLERKGERAVKIGEEILDGMERPDPPPRVRVYPKQGIRVVNKMSNADRVLLWDISGRAGWYKDAKVAEKEVVKQLRNTVDAQAGWEKRSRDRGETKDADEAKRIKEEAQRMLDMIDEYGLEFKQPQARRNIYTVSLHEGKDPSQYDYLEWEKVVSNKQLDKIRKGITEAYSENNPIRKTLEKRIEDRLKAYPSSVTGQQIYSTISDVFGEGLRSNDKEASLFLLRAGIDGIKYPAGSLSGQQNEGHNYVVFDEKAITIEERESFKLLTTASDLAPFSFSDLRPPEKPRYSVEQVKQFIALPLKRWGNIGTVKVIQTMGELPAKWMRYVVEDAKIMGAYDEETDTTYLIADNIGSARAAVVTLVHEAVGHRGIHAVLGPIQEKIVFRKITEAYKDTPLMQSIIKSYGLDMENDVDRRAAASELLAHLAETREKPSLWKQIVGYIRQSLRRVMPDLKWTDSDIAYLLQRARRFSGMVEKGKTGQYFKKDLSSTPKTIQDLFAQLDEQPTIFEDRTGKQTEPPPKDAPRKDIEGWFRRETGALFASLTRTFGTNSDFGKFLESMLKSPEWWTNPVLKRMVHYFADTRSELYHEYVYHLNNIEGRNVTKETEDMAKKSPEKYKQLMWAIDYGDTSWRRGKESMERLRDPDITREARLAVVENQVKKYEQYLRTKGLPEDVIDLWKLHRASYDRALDLMTEQMREMIAELEQEAKDLGMELPDSKKELLKTLNGWLASMEEWRGFYAPRLRQMGDWSLQLQKGDDKVRFHGSARQMESMLRKLRAEGWEPLTTKDGTEIPPVQKVRRLPEEVYQSLKSVDVAKAINYAMERSAKTAEVTAAFNDEVLELVSDMMKARGFRSTMIHRMEGKVIKGYEEDPIIRFVRYTNNISSGLAKAKVARLAYEEVLGRENEEGKREGGLHPVDDKAEYVLAQRYITAQLRNLDHTDRIIGMAKSLATFKFLGINPRSIMVNLTALATTAPAAVHQYAGEGAVNMHRVLKELIRASKDASLIIVGKEPNLNAHEKEYIEKIKKEGWDDPQYTKDALGAMQKTHQKWFNKTVAASMWGFGKSEQLNRLATLLAGYRIAYGEALKRGMEGKEAEKYAEEKAKKGSDKAHGIYGRATLPMIAQLPYIGKIGQLMYVYGKFGHNYVQMLYDLGMNQHNYKSFVWGLLSPLVLAGGTVLPFKDILWSILGYILRMFGIGGDPEKGLWDWIRRQFGKQAETMGRYGLMGGLGMDISGSLSVGIDFPKSWSDFLGAPWAIVEDIGKAHHFLETGRPWRAAEKVLPTGLANISRAFREQREGLTTERGNRVFTPEGKIYQPSLGEMALRIAGFRSSQEATLSARTTEAKREKAYFEEKKRTIYEEYRAYLANPSKKEHEAVIQKVQEFNKQLREEGIKEVPRITFEQMRAQMKRMQKPTKAQQRLYAE